MWKAINSAKSLNMPTVSAVFRRVGFGSMAHNVPKNRSPGRMIGIEM